MSELQRSDRLPRGPRRSTDHENASQGAEGT